MRWKPGIKYYKDPSDVLDYTMDFSQELGSDTISTKAVSGDGVTIDSSSNSTTAVTAWVSGGSANCSGDVKVTVTTAAGRTYERSFTIVLRER